MRTDGHFIISLDFELLWGVKDLPSSNEYRCFVEGGRNAIPQILKLFDQYGVHATWATVGLMMNENKQELTENIPLKTPDFKNKICSAYQHLAGIGESEMDDKYHYGGSLIKQILETNGQELGTHTYSHYYCTEDGADRDSFAFDIAAAQEIMHKKYGVDCKSIVFPRNQYTDESIEVISEYGLSCYRGNPSKGYDPMKKGLSMKIQQVGRYLDSYFPLYGSITYNICERADKVINVPASRFFRPYSGHLLMEKMKIARIKGQMLRAAKDGRMFHLWWHPHNFGRNTEHMLAELEEVLVYYSELKSRYRLKSVNMGEYAEMLNAMGEK